MLSERPKLRGGAGDFETIPEGVYTLQILDVDAVSWEYKGKENKGFNFKFGILDDEELPESGDSTRGRFLWWRVTDSINKRSNLYKLASAVLGRKLTDEEQDPEDADSLYPNDLVGLQIMGVIENNEDNEGNVWSNIASVSKVKTELEAMEYEAEEATVTKTVTKPVKKIIEKVVEEEDEEDEEEEEDESFSINDFDKDINDDDDDDDDAELEALRRAKMKADARLAEMKAQKKARKNK